MCADQPAVREHANIAGASCGGTPATSRTTADQYSTFVHEWLGLFFAIASCATCSSSSATVDARRPELLRDALEDARARILGAVDAMAEAHDPLAAAERVGDPLLRVARLGDRVEHRQHARGRAAVQRARERADRRRERGAGVGSGRGDDPRREGRRVETVLGGADPVRVDRLRRLLVQLAAPLEDEPLGGGLPCGDGLRGDGRQIGAARGLGDDRERGRREPAEILLRLLVVDVDELAELPLAAERREADWRSAM